MTVDEPVFSSSIIHVQMQTKHHTWIHYFYLYFILVLPGQYFYYSNQRFVECDQSELDLDFTAVYVYLRALTNKFLVR